MSLNQNEEESDKAAKIAGLILLFMFILYLMMLVKQSLARNLVMLPIQVTETSRRYNIRKCNYKKNAGISKNISIFLKFSPKITILYKVSPKQSNYDRERKEETGNVRTAIC